MEGQFAIVKRYINLEARLLIETCFMELLGTFYCKGTKVEVETCEMNTVLIDGTYYDLGDVQGELIELKEVK